MLNRIEKIFRGNTPKANREWLEGALTAIPQERAIIPCAGQFTLAKTAIQAGYDKSKIHTSDITFFTSMLGYLYSGRGLGELEFELQDGVDVGVGTLDLATEYEKRSTDVDRAALLSWAIKLRQLKPDVYFERNFLEEFWRDPDRYQTQFAERLRNRIDYYAGIQYEVADVRDVLEAHPRRGRCC